MVNLREVDEGNWRLGLKVSEEQKHWVSDSCAMLARAWAYRNSGSHAFVIYDDETPVGMSLYHDCDYYDAYDLSQLFIDERYQGKGFGLAASQLMLDMMKAEGKYKKVVLCYIEGNEGAKRLYEKLGFYLTGEADEDEIIMEKIL